MRPSESEQRPLRSPSANGHMVPASGSPRIPSPYDTTEAESDAQTEHESNGVAKALRVDPKLDVSVLTPPSSRSLISPRRYQVLHPTHPAESDTAFDRDDSADDEAVEPADEPTGCRRSLARLMRSPAFQLIIAGAGFLCDAYDLFVINLVLLILSFAEPHSSGDASLVADAVLVGSVLGQLGFGLIADRIGRKRGFVATLSLLTVGALLSALSYPVGSLRVVHTLAMSRFLLGVGIGGEYPLAATVTSEARPETTGRGKRVAAVFSMQGVGALCAPLIVLALLGSMGPGRLNEVWRLALGLGAIPGVIMLYFRIRMKESKVFTQAQKEEARAIAADTHASGLDVRGRPSLASAAAAKWGQLRAHSRDLLGTAGSWLIFDIPFYANGLFSSAVMSQWYSRPASSDTEAVHAYIIKIGLASMYLSLCALPGYWCATLSIDWLGRRRLQLLGFLGMVLSYLLCGIVAPHISSSPTLFFATYGLTFFFCNFANVSTFVIPSELFPTGVRATAHGISAAAGKVGAVIGGLLMPPLLAIGSHRDSDGEEGSDSDGPGNLSAVMYLCAAVSVLGYVWTYVLTRESANLELSQNNARTGSTPRSPRGDLRSLAIDEA